MTMFILTLQITNLIIDGIHDESEMSLNYERVEQDELVNTLKKFLEIEELGISI